MTRRTAACIAALGLLLLGGCAAPPPLPEYAWVDHATALRTLSERARSVRTISASGSIVMGRDESSAVHLDGALAAQVPDRLRVRAWKFGHAAFDLTLTPDGLWLMTGEDAPADAQDSLKGLTSERFAEAWSVFTGDFFEGGNPQIVDEGGDTFVVSRPWGTSNARVSAVVDRRTLTVRRFTVLESATQKWQNLLLEDYREFGGLPWPMKITAQGESGHLILDMDEVELNTELPPQAFRPPARAVKHQ